MPTDAAGLQPEARLVAAYRLLTRRINELIRLAETDAARERLIAQLAEVQRALRAEIGAEVAYTGPGMTRTYARSASAAQNSLQAAGVAIRTGFTGFDRAAVRTLQTRISDRLSAQRIALTEGLALGDPRLIQDRLEAAIVGDNALVRVVGGQVKVITPTGRFWDPEKYAQMLSRTATADARRVSFRQRYLQNGVDVVRVVPNGTIHEVCKVWEGKLLSLTGATPGLPTVEDARAAGLFHPNCRHRYVVARNVAQPEIPRGALGFPEPETPRPTLGFQAPGVAELDVRTPEAPRTPTATRAPDTPRL